MRKKIILVDSYCCCACPTGRYHNIKCAFTTQRDENPEGMEPPKPSVISFCPRTSQLCVWTYADTNRFTVKA